MQPDLFTGAARGRIGPPQLLADTEADYTPEAVAVQCLLAWWESGDPDCLVAILDLAAGSGVWSRAARAAWRRRCTATRPLQIHGVDVRGDEAANLAAACDTYAIGSVYGPAARVGAPYDAIIGNPFFTGFADGLPENLRERGLLRERGWLGLLGLSQWGQSEAMAAPMRRWPPHLQLRLGGRPQYRGDGKGDSREYSFWVWQNIDERDRRLSGPRPTWRCEQLPVLPVGLRRWTPDAVPGTRPIDPALVELIRGRYL